MLPFGLISIILFFFIVFNSLYRERFFDSSNEQFDEKAETLSVKLERYKLNQPFYDYRLIYPQLGLIHNQNHKNIHTEMKQLLDTHWMEWPEKELYNNNNLDGSWTIIPLYGFGIWCKQFMNVLPCLYDFLKKMKGLKVAVISKLKPFSKLNPHQGWGFHSNKVLRCHYGIVLPYKRTDSYICVMEDFDSVDKSIQYHKQNDWIVFDDSKVHYAVNDSNEERIVLIVDLERPTLVEKGNAQNNSTEELLQFVTELKNCNLGKDEKIPEEYIELCNNL